MKLFQGHEDAEWRSWDRTCLLLTASLLRVRLCIGGGVWRPLNIYKSATVLNSLLWQWWVHGSPGGAQGTCLAAWVPPHPHYSPGDSLAMPGREARGCSCPPGSPGIAVCGNSFCCWAEAMDCVTALLSRAVKYVGRPRPPPPPYRDSFLALDRCVLPCCKKSIFLESLSPLCISEICIYLGVWI